LTILPQQHCQWQKEQTLELWQPPKTLWTKPISTTRLVLSARGEQVYQMKDWSFGQLCRLAGVAKETVNRLTSATAAMIFRETLPRGDKPLQLFAQGDQLYSIHAASYMRLFNADLLAVVQEFAVDFQPPPKGVNGATGLYGGEQDVFCFLIDPAGWTDFSRKTSSGTRSKSWTSAANIPRTCMKPSARFAGPSSWRMFSSGKVDHGAGAGQIVRSHILDVRNQE
jgi:hypothetical protein